MRYATCTLTVMIINSPRANNQLEMRLNFSKIATIYKCYAHLSPFTANDVSIAKP